MKTLKFAPHLVTMILEGKKTTTWRLFDDKDLAEENQLSLIAKETGKEFGQATVITVYEKKLKDISEVDYVGHERFESEEKMHEMYKVYYGDRVTPETIVKVVRFTLL